jgi:hypothetical protein
MISNESLTVKLNELENRSRKYCDTDMLDLVIQTRRLMAENLELYESLDKIKSAVSESVKLLNEVLV